MNDQARILRGLMDRRGEMDSPPASGDARWPHAVVVTSGKGGVGKSVIALNLAVALAQQGHAVGLLDAALGTGNIELLCGLSSYWNFHHVLSGSRTVRQICLEGPAGVILIPGGSLLCGLPESVPQRSVQSQLEDVERSFDFVVIDAGVTTVPGMATGLAAADQFLLVTTPEPTSIAAAYSTIKHAAGSASEFATELRVLVNRAESPEQAHETLFRLQKTARVFLNSQPASAGWLPEDEIVRLAVAQRRPFVLAAPDDPVSQALCDLSRRVEQAASRGVRSESFFGRLLSSAVSAAA